MSTFPTGTILTRKEAQDDPFDRIRVIGLSPVSAPEAAEWGSANEGEAVVVTPADEFGENRPTPVTYLAAAYNVESYPDPEPNEEYHGAAARPAPRSITSEPSPEQAFARAAYEEAPVAPETTPAPEAEPEA